MISLLIANTNPKITFREGLSMLTPYIVIQLEKEGKGFPLFEVIVGPTPHRELALNSVSMLISRQGLDGVRVGLSDIPFRSW